jgi:hypothetical protein
MVQRENKIIARAEKACNKISGKVIRQLQKMTAGMQSGDDSPLKNIWDEVCVQVQGQESALWDYYLNVIGELIRTELTPVGAETKLAIWLQTDQGADWEMNLESRVSEGEEVPEKIEVDEDGLIEFILNEYVLKTAADYKNKRIVKFLDGEMDLEE